MPGPYHTGQRYFTEHGSAESIDLKHI